MSKFKRLFVNIFDFFREPQITNPIPTDKKIEDAEKVHQIESEFLLHDREIAFLRKRVQILRHGRRSDDGSGDHNSTHV